MSVRPRRPFTLTARLVAVAVLLVALTAVVIAAATALVMRDHLSDKLDESVLASIRRAEEKAALSRDQGGVMNENIGNMVPAVGEVSRMLDGIAAATEQHASATASIHGLVEQAAGIARERVRQLDRTREDMAALTEVAQGLQQATGRFRVSSLGQPG